MRFHVEHKLENIQNCPLCESGNLKDDLSLKDYFLSQESFVIQKCVDCGFEFTNPRPSKEAIGEYYKSDDYISHSNKNKGLFAKLYQLARKVNLASKHAIISRHIEIGKALDIGSGTGHFLNYLENRQWMVQGIEPDEEAAKFSRENFNLKVNAESKIAELENDSFDLITMWHVLEHVHDLNQRMADLSRLIRRDGIVILALPNVDSFDALRYDKYWAAYDVPRHLYHFSKNDVSRLAAKHNFSVENIYPMRMDAFYVSLLSEKYRAKKGAAIRAFWTAFRSNLKSSSQKPNTSSLIYVLQPKRP